jgi:hypothetical protein
MAINAKVIAIIVAASLYSLVSAAQTRWWNLAKNSFPVMEASVVRFRTNAREIVVRYTVEGPTPRVSGMDLYAIDANGAGKSILGKGQFADTITYHFSELNDVAREYRLYLPAAKVKWMEVGTASNDSITPLHKRPEKPIVIYGKQDSWTSLLDRQMDRPVINLELYDNDIDAKVYVLDCLPELIPGAVTKLRRKRPATPILVGSANVYKQLQAKGIKHLYLLDVSQIKPGDDTSMQAYANVYETSLRNILHEPIGNINTTIPCRQYRELMRYDWDARHNEILTMNNTKAPRTVLIGNSITHFWGGLPAGPIARGTDSWKEVMDPVGARNMGFGWDRIENVLWRVYHDELDGYAANKIYIMIGTNNLEMNTNEEIIAGLKLIVSAIKQCQPKAGILLSGILPRANQEKRIVLINQGIMQMAGTEQVQFVNPGTVLLKADATIDNSLFTDGLHPNGIGYSKLAHYLQPYLK